MITCGTLPKSRLAIERHLPIAADRESAFGGLANIALEYCTWRRPPAATPLRVRHRITVYDEAGRYDTAPGGPGISLAAVVLANLSAE